MKDEKIHYGWDGSAECGAENPQLTKDPGAVTCSTCRGWLPIVAHELQRSHPPTESGELEERLRVAEGALHHHGYRKSCDIPACNCGDQWNHGGNAATRLHEIYEALEDRTQGVTALDAIKKLVARDDDAYQRGLAEGLERAAKVAEEWTDAYDFPAQDIADTIRALKSAETKEQEP